MAAKRTRRSKAARAERKAAVSVDYHTSKIPPPQAVTKLFRAAGWDGDLARYSAKKVRLKLNRSHLVVTAWQEKELVGLATAVSDGVVCALVDNLLVHPSRRRQGVGRRLMKLMGRELRRQGVEYIFSLGSRSRKTDEFYGGTGFRSIPWRVFLHSRR